MEKTTQCIAGGGLLAAIVVVLQFAGSAIRLGPFSISLVLILIYLSDELVATAELEEKMKIALSRISEKLSS